MRVTTIHFALSTTHAKCNEVTITTPMPVFMVLSSLHSQCKSSPSSLNECRLSATWPLTLKSNQASWTASLPVGCYHLCASLPLLLLLSPNDNFCFTVPWKQEGWVDLSTAVTVWNPCPSLYITVAVMINVSSHGTFRTVGALTLPLGTRPLQSVDKKMTTLEKQWVRQ